MIAKRVHHVSFAVADLERSRHFYQNILGLQSIPRPDLGLAGIWYRAGEAEIHLIATPEGADVGGHPTAISPLANHSAFAIDDYAKVLDHLKSSGLEVMETSAARGQMWVQDPDGNVIELIAPRV